MPARPGRTALAIAVGITIVTNVPLFLVGALAVTIADDIDLPTWALGIASSAYWVLAAVASASAGIVARTLGARGLAVLTIALACASLLGLAFATPSWQAMVLWTALAGASNGIGHPASNALLNTSVTPSRLAFAFGIKQSAVPISGLLAGISLPLIALTLGWHAVFIVASVGGAALLTAFVLAGSGRRRATTPPPAEPRTRISGPLLRRLLLLSCGTMLTGGSVTALAAFFTTAGAERGIDPALAGTMLALGTALSATTRLTAGAVAGRPRFKPLRTIAFMALIGGCGMLVMTIPGPGFYIGGFLVATGIGWGWPGLVHYGISRIASHATLAATGIVQTGTYLGSTVSPILVGLILATPQNAGFAWLMLGCMSLGGAVMFTLAHRLDARTGR